MSDLRAYLSDAAQRELNTLRAALDARLLALEAALAHPEPHDSIEDLVMDLARAASAEAETSAAHRWLEAQLKAQDEAERGGAALRAELQQLQAALLAARERGDHLRRDAEAAQAALRAEHDKVARLDAELARERNAAANLQDAVNLLRKELEASQRDLETARRELESLAAGADEARRALGGAEAAARAAVARAEEAEFRARAAEERSNEFDAARQAAIGERATFEKQLAEVASRHQERIRELELQLFGREQGSPDADIDLASLLESPVTVEQPIRRFSRYTFRPGIEVRFDSESGELVDLSVGGAQVVSAAPLELEAQATFALVSDEIPVSCEGRVVWSRADPRSAGKIRRYRAGILFLNADPAAIEAFIIRYSAA